MKAFKSSIADAFALAVGKVSRTATCRVVIHIFIIILSVVHDIDIVNMYAQSA